MWYADRGAIRQTERMKADTRAWRTDADRILGLWDALLIGDHTRCVIKSELEGAFNAWLRANGHNEWSSELFHPRFIQHSETKRHGVEEGQPRNPKGLSRWRGASKSKTSRQPRVYRGIRFRTEEDEPREWGDTDDTSIRELF
jgi:putative DNA primase/helicase